MKSNRLIILLILVAWNTINLGSSLKFGNPSIEFVKNHKFPNKNNDLYIYSVQLRSNEKLLKFEVMPSIKGENVDSEVNHFFDENTHHVIFNYFYVLPKNLQSDEIVLTFKLTDSKESNVRREVIKLYGQVNRFANSNVKTEKREI